MKNQDITKICFKDVNDEKCENNCENIVVKECSIDDIQKIIYLLDLYMRTLLGQYDYIYEYIDWKLRIDDYPADKMLLRSVRDILISKIRGCDLNTSLGVNNPEFLEKGKIAYDMLQILRYQCHKEFNKNDTTSVASCPPYLCAKYLKDSKLFAEDNIERKKEIDLISKIIDDFHYMDIYPNSYHRSWAVCPLVIKEFNHENDTSVIYIHKHLMNIINYSKVFVELIYKDKKVNLYEAFKFLYWTVDKMSEQYSEDDWKIIEKSLNTVSKSIEAHLTCL